MIRALLLFLLLAFGLASSSNAQSDASGLVGCASPRASGTTPAGVTNCVVPTSENATTPTGLANGTVATAQETATATTTGTGTGTGTGTNTAGTGTLNRSCGTGRVLELDGNGSLSCRDLTWQEIYARIPTAACGTGQNVVGLNAQGTNCSPTMPVCGAGQVLKWVGGSDEGTATTTSGAQTSPQQTGSNATSTVASVGSNGGQTTAQQGYRCVDLAPRIRAKSPITKGHGVNVAVYNHDFCSLGVVSGTEKGACIIEPAGDGSGAHKTWKLTNHNAGHCSALCFDFEQ